MIRKFTQINESAQTYDNPLNLPPLETLGDGEFEGALWGHCFAYETAAGKPTHFSRGMKAA